MKDQAEAAIVSPPKTRYYAPKAGEQPGFHYREDDGNWYYFDCGRWWPIHKQWTPNHISDWIETDEHGTPLEHGGEVIEKVDQWHYVLIEYDDEGTCGMRAFATPEAREAATSLLLDGWEAEDIEKALSQLREDGVCKFESDAPLMWMDAHEFKHAEPRPAAGENPEAHDWPDDKRYMCRCAECRTQFMGPKLAPLCWRCWSKRKTAQPAPAAESILGMRLRADDTLPPGTAMIESGGKKLKIIVTDGEEKSRSAAHRSLPPCDHDECGPMKCDHAQPAPAAGETPRVENAKALYIKWKEESYELDMRGAKSMPSWPRPPDGWQFASDLERENTMLRNEWGRIKAEMDRDKHVVNARKGHDEALRRAAALRAEVERLRGENQHQFDALHELRAVMSRAGFLSGDPIRLDPAKARRYYEAVDRGMNPPPQAALADGEKTVPKE